MSFGKFSSDLLSVRDLHAPSPAVAEPWHNYKTHACRALADSHEPVDSAHG